MSVSKKRTVLYIDAELFAELRKLAFERNESRSDVINDAIREHIKAARSRQKDAATSSTK